MPRKNKIKTVFKDEAELYKFIFATCAECSAFGLVIQSDKLSDEDQESFLNTAMKNTVNRIQIAMSEYHKMRQNGDIKDLMSAIPVDHYEALRKDSFEFINKTMGEDYDWGELEEASKAKQEDR